MCLCAAAEGGIRSRVCQRNAPLAPEALVMNIKVLGLRVPELLCGPNQTHLSVLRLQAGPEPSVTLGGKEVERTRQMWHKMCYLEACELLNHEEVNICKIAQLLNQLTTVTRHIRLVTL